MATPETAVDVEALLDRGAWSPFQRLTLVLLSLAVILDGFNNQVIGFALPAMIADWGRSRADFAPVLSAGLIGMAAGTFVGGIAGDRWGRKPSLIGSVICFGLATTATVSCRAPLEVGVLRLIGGIAVGAALPNAAALAGEFTPERRRPFAVTAVIVCVPLGGVFGGLLAAKILPSLGWRALFLVGGLTPLLIAAALAAWPCESPRFLARSPARLDRLMATLKRCGLLWPDGGVPVTHAPAARAGVVGRLLSEWYRRDTLALWLSLFCTQVTVYLVFSWLPTLLKDHGLSLELASEGLAVNNLGGVAGALLSARAIETLGSRPTMIGCALGAAVAAAALFSLPLGSRTPTVGLLALLTIQGFFLNAVQTTLFALAVHIYATDVRTTGTGMALTMGRIGGILSAFLGAQVLNAGGASYFVILALAMASAALALAFVRRHVPGRVCSPAPSD